MKATRCAVKYWESIDRDEADCQSTTSHSLVRRRSTFTTRRVKSSILLGVSFHFSLDPSPLTLIRSLLECPAVITLLTAKYPDPEPIRRGCRLIMSRQESNGSWPQESIEGGSFPFSLPSLDSLYCTDNQVWERTVFNKNAAISYPNFKFAWTINALGQAWKKLPRDGW